MNKKQILKEWREKYEGANWDTVSSQSMDSMLSVLDAYLSLFEKAIREDELRYWVSFFRDPSMNAMTPSERLLERIEELQNKK